MDVAVASPRWAPALLDMRTNSASFHGAMSVARNLFTETHKMTYQSGRVSEQVIE